MPVDASSFATKDVSVSKPGAASSRGLWFPLTVFAFSLILFLLVRAYARIGSHITQPLVWDGSWYQQIIEQGYFTDGNLYQSSNVVYAPLYPMLCAGVKRLFSIPTFYAMLIVSAGCTLGAMVKLYRLLARMTSESVAKWSLLFLAFGPFSVFLYCGYSEPLFLFLAVLFFGALIDERWVTAGVIAGVASASRPYGPIMALTLAFAAARSYYLANGWKLNLKAWQLQGAAIGLPLCFTGTAAFSLYLYHRFSDPLLFIHNGLSWTDTGSQSPVFDGLAFAYIPRGVMESFRYFGPFSPGLVGLVLFALGPVIIFWLWRELPPLVIFFMLASFLFLHVTLLERDVEIVNLGRHFTLLPFYPLLLALAVDPKRIARFKFVPAVLLLLGFMALNIGYTIMYFYKRFVS